MSNERAHCKKCGRLYAGGATCKTCGEEFDIHRCQLCKRDEGPVGAYCSFCETPFEAPPVEGEKKGLTFNIAPQIETPADGVDYLLYMWGVAKFASVTSAGTLREYVETVTKDMTMNGFIVHPDHVKLVLGLNSRLTRLCLKSFFPNEVQATSLGEQVMGRKLTNGEQFLVRFMVTDNSTVDAKQELLTELKSLSWSYAPEALSLDLKYSPGGEYEGAELFGENDFAPLEWGATPLRTLSAERMFLGIIEKLRPQIEKAFDKSERMGNTIIQVDLGPYDTSLMVTAEEEDHGEKVAAPAGTVEAPVVEAEQVDWRASKEAPLIDVWDEERERTRKFGYVHERFDASGDHCVVRATIQFNRVEGTARYIMPIDVNRLERDTTPFIIIGLDSTKEGDAQYRAVYDTATTLEHARNSVASYNLTDVVIFKKVLEDESRLSVGEIYILKDLGWRGKMWEKIGEMDDEEDAITVAVFFNDKDNGAYKYGYVNNNDTLVVV